MKDLENLRDGLMQSTALLMKDSGKKIDCSFVKEGMVQQMVVIEDEVLASALRKTGVSGILEGEDLHEFRSRFDGFSLHVKAQKLYRALVLAE